MIIFELPCIFIQNIEEIEYAKENNLTVPAEVESYQTTKFRVPEDYMIVINGTSEDRATLRVYTKYEEFNWGVNASYELVDEVIETARKKAENKASVS